MQYLYPVIILLFAVALIDRIEKLNCLKTAGKFRRVCFKFSFLPRNLFRRTFWEISDTPCLNISVSTG